MHTLRLTQHTIGENRYKVEISLEGGTFRQSAVPEFEFSLSAFPISSKTGRVVIRTDLSASS